MDFDQNISNASSALPADGRDFLTGFQHRNPLSTIPGHHIFIQLFGTFPYILYSLLFMYREEAEKAKKKKNYQRCGSEESPALQTRTSLASDTTANG